MKKNFGALYIVATPIGNLQDITLRALDILKMVDLIAAEDVRVSKILLKHYGIKTAMISLHDHNEEQRLEFLSKRLSAGKNIALVSDAGTPLINDPGYRLVKAMYGKNIKVIPIPGACAAITALSVAGLPTDRFVFEGFLSAKKTQRLRQLMELKNETKTMIFYESPHRILDVLSDMMDVFGAERYVVLARELTKIFENIYAAELGNLLSWIKNDRYRQKGELVILVQGAIISKSKLDDGIDVEAERILKILSCSLSRSQAAKLTAKICKNQLSKKKLYNSAIF